MNWRPVVGYEGLYEVSDTGSVRSLDRYVKYPLNGGGFRLVKGKVMSLYLRRDGYKNVGLSKQAKTVIKFVHELVLLSFAGPRPLGYVCNHKNSDRSCNILNNLEWVTYSQNNTHPYETFRIKCRGSHYNSKISDSNRDLIRKLVKRKNIPQRTIANHFGVTIACISLISREGPVSKYGSI